MGIYPPTCDEKALAATMKEPRTAAKESALIENF